MKVLAGCFKNKNCTLTGKNLIVDGLISREKIPLIEIVSFDAETQENSTKGGLGSAAAGGLLFGGAGAIIGAVVGRGTNTETTAAVTLIDGRRFLAKFSGSEMELVRAALFEVEGMSLDDRKSGKAAQMARQKHVKEMAGKALIWVPFAAIVVWLVIANT